jgi:hypothetical protein
MLSSHYLLLLIAILNTFPVYLPTNNSHCDVMFLTLPPIIASIEIGRKHAGKGRDRCPEKIANFESQ